MKKAYIIIAATAMLAAGCQRENPFNGMELVAEGFGGGTKAAVDGNASYWVAGELVNINGAEKAVEISGNTAYVTDVEHADQYRALYPASLNSSYDGSSASVTVTIPTAYEWAVDGSGRQVLDVPMAAYGTGSGRLVFKHLTAAITVEITNYYGFPVLVDNVTVSSSDAGTQYQLCGSKEITLNSSDISVNAAASNSNNSVAVNFNDNNLTIAPGETKRVQVPVLPVGDGNKFSISVAVHKDGDVAVAKTFTKTQTTGGAMGRAKMAYAGDTVGFTFSVYSAENGSRKVILSPGNLQSVGGNWQFAAHQYDYFGAGDAYQYDGHRDLFNEDNPTYTIPAGWELLRPNECNDLLNNRTVTNTLSPDTRYALASVAGKNGMIIFPDNYTHPDGTGLTSETFTTTGYTSTVTADGWAKMEAAGCVFLPAAGWRNIDGSWINDYLSGYYRSSHEGFSLYFWGTGINPYDTGATSSYWFSIRPIMVVD